MRDYSKVSRRTVLTWGGLFVAAASIPGTAHAGEQDGPVLDATEAGLVPVLVPGHDPDILVPQDLGISASGPLPSGSEFTIEFDPRLYRVSKQPRVVHQGQPVDHLVAKTSPSAITVTLTQAVPSGSLTIVAGQLTPNRYPYDILRDVKEPAVIHGTKNRKPGQKRDLAQKRNKQAETESWGAECGALWEQISWGTGYRYFTPQSASVKSTGPGPIPAGSRIRMLCDKNIVEKLMVTGSTDSGGRKFSGRSHALNLTDVAGVEWTTDAEVPPGELIRLAISSKVSDRLKELDGGKYPTIEIVAPREKRETQRTTYLETIHRQDVIVSAETLRAHRLSTAEGLGGK